MSKLPLTNMKGERVGEVDIADGVLQREGGDQLVHDAVVAHRAALRSGSANTLGKGAVAGTGKKPWKQKGTGRARAGYVRSPVWRGGGVAHGPHPRDYDKPLPKKMARAAFRRAFSARVEAGEVIVLEALALAEGKTKLMAELQRKLNAPRGVLIVVEKADAHLLRAARNLPRLEIASATDVDTYTMLRWPLVAVTQGALTALEKRLQAAAGRKAE